MGRPRHDGRKSSAWRQDRTRRRRKRMGLVEAAPLARLSELDVELRTIAAAVKALNRRKVGVLNSYRAAMRRIRWNGTDWEEVS